MYLELELSWSSYDLRWMMQLPEGCHYHEEFHGCLVSKRFDSRLYTVVRIAARLVKTFGERWIKGGGTHQSLMDLLVLPHRMPSDQASLRELITYSWIHRKPFGDNI